MERSISNQAKRITWILALVYFSSYLLRKNFSVMLAAITASGFNAVSLGAVCSAMTVSYGVGQIVNGILSDKIRPHIMLTVGLVFSTLCNFAMFFCYTVPLMAVVWFFNGFAQSMLWPPIVRLMLTYMNDLEYGYAAVRISCASSVATILLYVLSPLLLKIMEWQCVIICFAALGTAITCVWMICSSRMFKSKIDNFGDSLCDKESMPLNSATGMRNSFSICLITISILVAIVIHGALRDGVGDWMPTFMSEVFNIDVGNAILIGVLPTILSIVSFYLFDELYRKFFKDEIKFAFIIFVAASLFSLILLLIFSRCISGQLVSVITCALIIGVIIMCMNGINLMLVVMLPKRFAKSGRVSTITGFLNSATYMGSAIAMPLFPAIRGRYCWSVTIGVWIAVSLIGAVACMIATSLWKRSKDKNTVDL